MLFLDNLAYIFLYQQNFTDPNVIQQIQQLQRMLVKSSENRSDPVHFDKKLLDFDYGEEEEEPSPRQPPPPQPNPADSVARYTFSERKEVGFYFNFFFVVY